MVVRKNVRSTVKKDPLYIDEYHVYVVEGQKEVKENVGKDNEFIGYEVATETEYTKDEYIQKIHQLGQAVAHHADSTDTQQIPLFFGC